MAEIWFDDPEMRRFGDALEPLLQYGVRKNLVKAVFGPVSAESQKTTPSLWASGHRSPTKSQLLSIGQYLGLIDKKKDAHGNVIVVPKDQKANAHWNELEISRDSVETRRNDWKEYKSRFTSRFRGKGDNQLKGVQPCALSKTRENDLRNLASFVSNDTCRVLLVLGSRGTGKSTLLNQLCSNLIAQVKADKPISKRAGKAFVVARTLDGTQTLLQRLADLCSAFPKPPSFSKSPVTLEDYKSLFMFYRDHHEGVFVLDNFEVLLDNTGKFTPEAKEFLTLIEEFGRTQHQSCLILSSTKQPVDIAWSSSWPNNSPFCQYEPSKLRDEDCQEILVGGGLQGTMDECLILANQYSRNLYLLNSLIRRIKNSYNSQIGAFLSATPVTGTSVSRFGYDRLVSEPYEQLSEVQKQLMMWLSIEYEPISIEVLCDDIEDLGQDERPIVQENLLRELEKAVTSSAGELIVQADIQGYYTVSNIAMNWALEKIVAGAFSDIKNNRADTLQRYALLKGTSSENVKLIQMRLIVKPLVVRLINEFGSKVEAQRRVLRYWNKMRINYSQANFFAANMLILLNELDTDLTKIDFTGCLIRRVDFANRKLRVNGVNFSRAQFDLCRFNWSFGPVQSVAISKNRNFVVAGTADKKLLFWQLGLRRPRAIKVEEDVSAIWALTLDRDGTQLASCSETSITVWELSISPLDGGSPGNFTIGTRWNRDKAHAERIHSLTFDSDGKVILSASADGTIAIHHAATGELISMQAVSNARDAQTRPVRIALFSPDNQFIATAGRDGLIRLWAWDGASVSLLHQVTSGQEWVESLAFSPDGRLLASGGKDGTIRIWDVRNIGKRKCLHILTPHTDWVTGISFTSDGKSLLSVSDDKFIKQSNFASGKVEIGPSVLGGLNWINSMALSIDNKAVVTCSTDKTVRVWDMPMLTESRRLNGYTNPLWSIAIDPSGSRAACAYDDGDVREWEIASGKLLRILPSESESFELDRHTNHVRAIAYRADGQRLFSGGDDHNIIVWDDHTSTPVEEKIKLPERIRSLSVSPNGRYLAVGNTSSSVNFVDTYFPKLTRTLSGHFDSVSAVAFNHSGTLLATGSYDATIRLWNIDQIVDQPASSSFQTPSLELRHTYKVRAVVFGHDDKWIAAGGYDGRLIVWQLDGNNIVERNILAHSEAIRTLAVSQNGQWLASGCHDGKIKLWNLLDQWRPIDLPVASNVAIRTLAFAQNKLLSGGDDGVMRIWDTTGDFTNLQNMKPRTVVVARPYENMRITDANGLSVAQQKALISLGACR